MKTFRNFLSDHQTLLTSYSYCNVCHELLSTYLPIELGDQSTMYY